jgi:type II secretory pathway component PulF
MEDILVQLCQEGPARGILGLTFSFVGYILLGLIPACGSVYLLYFLFTLPMRRNERARMVLDCLELGLRQGRTPELALTSIAESRDRSFGARFYLLAEHLRAGRRLSEALLLVPRLLPPQVIAMLRAGERVGDIAKVLPACRQVLRDGTSQVRGALNYVILVVFVASPALVLVPIFFNIYVMPKYNEVFSQISGAQLPAFTRVVLSQSTTFTLIQLAALLFIWLAVLAYLGGPRLRRWIAKIAPGLPDRIDLWLPWRWRRAERDFSTILGILLDTGIAESEAVTIAAQATGNSVITNRSAATLDALRQGVKLPEALKAIDRSGELRWRIANAAHGGGFTRALAGWQASLDAKAFQLEQSAAQIATSVLVLVNGVVVGCFVISIFLALVRMLNAAPLW